MADEAIKALTATRTALEKLIATVYTNDHYALAKLGTILSELKNAQSELNELNTGS